MSFDGVSNLIADAISKDLENVLYDDVRTVQSDYFRGRYSTKDIDTTNNSDQISFDRVFDDVLMYNNVISRYSPIREKRGKNTTKGLTVNFASQTILNAITLKPDYVVLMTPDSDYIPLIRCLHSLGFKTVIAGFEFESTNSKGEKSITVVSDELKRTCFHYIDMIDLISITSLEDDDIYVKNNL